MISLLGGDSLKMKCISPLVCMSVILFVFFDNSKTSYNYIVKLGYTGFSLN